MKARRQAAIAALVRERRIPNQEALRRLLDERGFAVTQATLSRDVNELGLVKLTDADGGYYAVPQAAAVPRADLSRVLPSFLLGVDGVGPLVVARTVAGSAATVASALSQAGWSEVIGVVPGDDTVLVVLRTPAAREAVAGRLRELSRMR